MAPSDFLASTEAQERYGEHDPQVLLQCCRHYNKRETNESIFNETFTHIVILILFSMLSDFGSLHTSKISSSLLRLRKTPHRENMRLEISQPV